MKKIILYFITIVSALHVNAQSLIPNPWTEGFDASSSIPTTWGSAVNLWLVSDPGWGNPGKCLQTLHSAYTLNTGFIITPKTLINKTDIFSFDFKQTELDSASNEWVVAKANSGYIKVYVSDDDGQSFKQIDSFQSTATASWEQRKYSLASFADSTICFKLESHSFGTAYMGILIVNFDNFKIDNCAPPPSLNLGNDTAFCEGTSLTLNAGNNNAGTTFLWSDKSTNQTLTVNTPETYFVTVSSGVNCSRADTIKITKNLIPVIDLGNDTSFCEGTSLILSASYSDTVGTFLWSNKSTQRVIRIDTPGTYFVTASSGVNCSGSDTIKVTKNLIPVVNLGNDTTFCEGATFILSAGDYNTKTTFLWSDKSTEQAITITTPGTYFLKVSSGVNCSASDTIEIAQSPLPSAAYINVNGTDPQFTFSAAKTQNTDTYSWDFGDSSHIVNGDTVNHTYERNGTYEVSVTMTNDCGSTTLTKLVTVNGSTGILYAGRTEEELISVYPNPATNELNISNKNLAIPIRFIRIYNILGQEKGIYKMEDQSLSTINISQLPSGVYTLIFQFDDGLLNRKLNIIN